MGYTHYFRQGKSVPKAKWEELCKDVEAIVKEVERLGIPIESNADNGLIINKDFISFNGVGDDAHETLYIEKKIDRTGYAYDKKEKTSFNFCKTAAKPYDLAVTAVLLRLHKVGGFRLSSDGDSDDWLPAVKLCFSVFGELNELPAGLATDYKNEEYAEYVKEIKEKLSLVDTLEKTASSEDVKQKIKRKL